MKQLYYKFSPDYTYRHIVLDVYEQDFSFLKRVISFQCEVEMSDPYKQNLYSDISISYGYQNINHRHQISLQLARQQVPFLPVKKAITDQILNDFKEQVSLWILEQ